MSRSTLLALATLVSSVALAVAAAGVLPAEPLDLRVLGQSLRVGTPRALALLALLPGVLVGVVGSLADMPGRQRALSLLLRGLLLTLIALALSEPSRTSRDARVALVVAVDVSDSIGNEALGEVRTRLAALSADPDLHEVELLVFAGRARRLDWSPGAPVPPLRPASQTPTAPAAVTGEDLLPADTDLARAVELALASFPPGHLRRLLVVSDGRATRGDLLGAARRAAALDTEIHHWTLEAAAPDEVAVEGIELPEDANVGVAFELTAVLHATRSREVTVRLYRDGSLDGAGAVRQVALDEGRNEVRFSSLSRLPGELRYRVVVDPGDADTFAENNAATATVRVKGSPRVLVIDPQPARVAQLGRALTAAELDVEVRSAAGTPRTLGELAAFDFVILSDTPAHALSREQMGLLRRYVRDGGGGLLVAGGEQAFGPGGYADTPLERLLPVRMDARRHLEDPTLALALVIDCSGSMAGLKMELAREAAAATASVLGPEDALGVIGFSGQPERVLRMQRAGRARKVEHSLRRLMARGGTAIFPALDLAYQDLLVTGARIKHVILLTDGQTQEQGIPELVQHMRADAITVSTVGLGGDVHRSLLQKVANLGGGRAHFTEDPHNVPRIFVHETSTVGRNSAVEEYFQPVLVERADFMRGLPVDRMPLLRGYVATEPRPRPAQVLLASELGEPVLARWHVGLGWALAWTPDLHTRWSPDLLRWSPFPRFLGQLVREHMRGRTARSLPMRAFREGDTVVVEVDAVDDADRFMNDLSSELRVAREGDPDAAPDALPMRQEAPGLYRARLRPQKPGSLDFLALHSRNDVAIARSVARFAFPYPREYQPGEADPALAAAAAATGGGPSEDPGALLDPGEARVVAAQPLWPWALLAALVVFFFDLVVRRLPGAMGGPRGGSTAVEALEM